MAVRVLVLGAGFGGLELATVLSAELGDDVEVTVIDKSDAFVFGYSKLDVLFGRTSLEAVRLPYAAMSKPGVRILRESVLAIDAEALRVTTDRGRHECDYLVIALGADYDYEATPGLTERHEFYSVAGAAHLSKVLPSLSGGQAIVGVCGAPFKCPSALSEAALLLHERGPRRPRRRRLLHRAEPARHVSEAVGCPGRRTGGVRTEAPRPLVRALRGQQLVVVEVGGGGLHESYTELVRAAIDPGVPPSSVRTTTVTD